MRRRNLSKWLIVATGSLALFALLAFIGLRIVLARVPQYQREIKSWVHERSGLYVRFAEVRPALRWYGPELYFDHPELRSADDARTLARAGGASIALDLWNSIASLTWRAGRISLDEPRLEVVRLGPTRFALAGELEWQPSGRDLRQTLASLPHGRVRVRHGLVMLEGWNSELPRLRFGEVDVDIDRIGDGGETSLTAVMPAQLRGSISLHLDVWNLSDPHEWQWRGILRAREVSLPGWHLVAPGYSNSMSSGTARIDLAALGRSEELTNVSLDFTASRVVVASPEGPGSALAEAGGALTLAHAGSRWTLKGRRIRALAPHRTARETDFEASWRAESGTLLDLTTRIDYLDLNSLDPIIALLPQKSLRERLRTVGATGEWFDTALRYTRSAGSGVAKWRAQGQFAHAGFAPMGAAPGLSDLTGRFDGNEAGGELVLNSPGARMSWPSQWQQPIELNVAHVTLYWVRTADGTLLAGRDWRLANADFDSQTTFAWQQFDDQRSPELTLSSSIANANAAAASRYLPRGRIGPKALAWLDRAFVAGRVPRAQFVFRGPVRKFPFRDDSGLFLVRFPVEGMTLDYREGWPRIENLALEAEFRNQGLVARIRHGTTAGLTIDRGEASFADFKNGELNVDVSASGDASSAFAYLTATPLDAQADGIFKAIEAAGPISADIRLFFPFKEFQRRRVLVDVDLGGVSAVHRGSALAATDLRGKIDFDGPQVPFADIRGRALGGALQVRARSPSSAADRVTELELRGTASVEAIRGRLNLPAETLDGARVEWRGSARLAPEPQRDRSLRVSSNLLGLSINLPEPVRKPVGQPMPLAAQIEWLRGGGLLVRAGLSPVGQTVLAFEPAGGELRLKRGAVMFGQASATLPETTGLTIGGTLKHLDLSGWLDAPALKRAAPMMAIGLQRAQFEVNDLELRAVAIHDIWIDATPQLDHWDVEIAGPDARGTISVPRDSAASTHWDLAFSHLKLSDNDAGAGDSGPTNLSPTSLPAISFTAKDLAWGEHEFGAVDLQIARLSDGIDLEHVTARSAVLKLDAAGSWGGADGGRALLRGTFTSSDVGAALKQLGFEDAVQAKSGKLEFDLNWTGAQSAEALATLSGQIKLDIEKGQLSSVDPGAGRVLGLASIATLPRRLLLDFSDLTDKGLAFDSIRGHFAIRDGDAYTDDVLLEGPAAEIGLIGRVGLVKHDYDQTAAVSGSVSNTLPLASTLAAGPVVGAAVLVFSQVFKQPLKGLSRGYYRIIGSWDNPLIERVKGSEVAGASRRDIQTTAGKQ